MPPLLALLAVTGFLGAIGYAAWILSRDAAAPKAIPDPPYERALGALLNGDRDEAIRAGLGRASEAGIITEGWTLVDAQPARAPRARSSPSHRSKLSPAARCVTK